MCFVITHPVDCDLCGTLSNKNSINTSNSSNHIDNDNDDDNNNK